MKRENTMKITVAGVGYVGLSNAAMLARNHDVYTCSINPEKAARLNAGISPIKDPYLERYLASGKLHLTATTDPEKAYSDAEYIIIATPTNYDPELQTFDTSSIEQVLTLAQRYAPKAAVVIRSTVPVGYTKKLRGQFSGRKLLFSPEFLREGRALYDSLHPSRIIVGADTDCRVEAERFALLLQAGAEDTNIPVRFMPPTEAEAIKLFANTYLALRVSYFNELDTYAEIHGLDTRAIIDGVCLDPRIGEHYNNPSFGYGGYCLPKDTKQLLTNYRDVPENLIEAIVRSNDTRKAFIAHRAMELAQQNSTGDRVTIGVFRLTMKSGSDNFRESSIFDVMEQLRDMGVELLIYEPTLEQKEYHEIPVVDEFTCFANQCDLILANRWEPELESYKRKIYTRDLFQCD